MVVLLLAIISKHKVMSTCITVMHINDDDDDDVVVDDDDDVTMIFDRNSTTRQMFMRLRFHTYMHAE